jgi:hypothetical protein
VPSRPRHVKRPTASQSSPSVSTRLVVRIESLPPKSSSFSIRKEYTNLQPADSIIYLAISSLHPSHLHPCDPFFHNRPYSLRRALDHASGPQRALRCAYGAFVSPAAFIRPRRWSAHVARNIERKSTLWRGMGGNCGDRGGSMVGCCSNSTRLVSLRNILFKSDFISCHVRWL